MMKALQGVLAVLAATVVLLPATASAQQQTQAGAPVAAPGILSQTINNLGQTVLRTVDSAGNILLRTLDGAGHVVSDRTIGRLLDLPVVSEVRNPTGGIVRLVQDTTGNILEYTIDGAGRITGARVVAQPGGGTPTQFVPVPSAPPVQNIVKPSPQPGTLAGQVAAILAQGVSTDGKIVQRFVDTNYNIIERTLDNTGRFVSQALIGRVMDMQAIARSVDVQGRTVVQAKDVTGAIIEATLDGAGRIVGMRVYPVTPAQGAPAQGAVRR